MEIRLLIISAGVQYAEIFYRKCIFVILNITTVLTSGKKRIKGSILYFIIYFLLFPLLLFPIVVTTILNIPLMPLFGFPLFIIGKVTVP